MTRASWSWSRIRASAGSGIDLLDVVLDERHRRRLHDLGGEERLERLGHGEGHEAGPRPAGRRGRRGARRRRSRASRRRRAACRRCPCARGRVEPAGAPPRSGRRAARGQASAAGPRTGGGPRRLERGRLAREGPQAVHPPAAAPPRARRGARRCPAGRRSGRRRVRTPNAIASAYSRSWVMLTATRSMPSWSARAAARPWSRTAGCPVGSRSISMSRQPMPRTPRPSTLLTASLAAQRPAKVSGRPRT